MNREKELLERIRQLEEQNSALQDKLDMIYSILAPDYEPDYEAGPDEDPDEDEDDEGGDDAGPRLVQIDMPSPRKGPK